LAISAQLAFLQTVGVGMVAKQGLTTRLFSTITSVALIAAAILVAITSAFTYRASGALSQAWSEYNTGAAAKTIALSELREAIGYAGMIHQFKNFIIRGDLQRLSVPRTPSTPTRLRLILAMSPPAAARWWRRPSPRWRGSTNPRARSRRSSA
jgi:hypothetical protein